MMVVYLSLSGNVERFVDRLSVKSLKLSPSRTANRIDEPFVMIVPTYDQEITDIISDFIDFGGNEQYLIGFVGSGNRNFNKEYVFNAKNLSRKYNKPLLFHFEFSGTDRDLVNFKRDVLSIVGTDIEQE